MKKRVLSILLAAVMLLPMAAACSENGAETDTPDTGLSPAPTAAEEVVEPEETELSDNLPASDFEGYGFHVGAQDGVYYGCAMIEQVLVEELNGDVVNDAVYNANRAVESRFNVQLGSVLFPDDSGATVKASIQAGDDVYDILTMHDITIANLSLTGLFRDVNEIPHLDYTRPWWPSYSVDSLTVGGSMYLISNYISYMNLAMTRAVFINKGIAEQYNYTIPYEKVKNGEWYLDDFIDMMQDVYLDVNGNGRRDDDDIYGFAASSALYAIQESFGVEPVKEDENGQLYLDINNETTVTLIEKFYHMMAETEGGYLNNAESIYTFASGNALFGMFDLGRVLSNLRDAEVTYGILPIPKLNELQADYISGSTDRPFAIPTTAQNDERLGVIIEAMSAEGYKQVRPAFFEIALKSKYAYDAESAEMLEIIGNTIVLDFSYIYSNFGGFAWTLMNMMSVGNPTKDFASYYAKNEKVQKKTLEKLQKSFNNLKNP
ncbi:MAG: extracellular solute-binding protein [Clostridia bacterium]|nr:extracellular solute-binding protein [Clostridia bacterium]MBQ3814495.1 extracellular solute-binding protein [Clostridia bacterium]